MTLHARQLLQELCSEGIGWDSVLPNEHIQRWHRWLSHIKSMADMEVPRHIGLSKVGVDNVQLHVFCDASDAGYGAVGYLRVVKTSSVSCHFLMGKSRVAPKKVTTIPRMELVAGVLAIKLTRHLMKELKYPINGSTIWTDSLIVLYYLKNTSSRFKTFVANRVRYILENSTGCSWRHVPSDRNPADVASRGATCLQSQEMKLWLYGPEFLTQSEGKWPQCKVVLPETDIGIDVRSVLTISTNPWYQSWFLRYSCWYKLLKAVAWMIRFKQYLMIMTGKRIDGSLKVGDLTLQELRIATDNVLRLVQEDCFGSQIDSSGRKSLKCLNPLQINGLICVGGRLQQSQCVTQRHPIIIPSKHHVTDLIIRSVHELNGHVGSVHVLANIRRNYWIVKGPSQVKRVLRNCSKCKLLYATPVEQIMSPLPYERVNVGSRPFRYCGVDYFGPFKVRSGRSDRKRYGCLFTCMQSRAVHIEIAHSLSTDSFIMALMRLVNRRGSPEIMFSDKGSNFVGAEKELATEWQGLDQRVIHNSLRDKGIEWQYNPPGASHRGGVWERIIRSIRKLLSAITNEQILSDEAMVTAMTEVERIINDRPLVPVYDDPQAKDILRPIDLLVLGGSDDMHICNNTNLAELYKKSWRQAQHVASTFWRRWLCEYLPLLQRRQKWTKVRRDVRKGDLVLIVDTAAPRSVWRKGLVVDVHISPDGHTRKVTIRTTKGEVTRDIRSICLLEGCED